MPSHTHGASTNSAGSHYHQQYANQQVSAGLNTSININSSQYPAATAWTDGWGENYNTKGTGTSATVGRTSSAGGHTHTVSVTATGGNNEHENRPPYEAVQRWKRNA